MSNQEQPNMMNIIDDARLNIDKIAQVLKKINDGMTAEEKMMIKDDLNGISYIASIIVLDAEISTERKEK